MIKTLSCNNRSYKCFFTSGMTRPVITMITANGVTRSVKNPVTIAKVLAAIAEEDHAEALEMNASLDAEFARIDELAPDEDAKAIFKAIASKYEVGCVMGVGAAHAEALEIDEVINTAVDVIKAMAGHDIKMVLAGVRSMMHHYGVITEVCAAAYTALRVAVEDSYTEALEMNKAHSL